MLLSISKWVQSSALVAILLVVLPLSCLSGTTSELSGYELRQFHKDRGGVVLDVCPRGIKAVTTKSNLVTICTPPDYRVVSYSPRTKKIFSTDIQHFTGEDRVLFVMTGTPQFDNIPIEKVANRTICGLPVERFDSPHSFGESQMALYHHNGATGSFPYLIHYSVSSKLAMQPRFAAFVSQYYRFPKSNGVAVELLYDSIGYEKCTELTTHTCRPKNFTRDDFTPPTNYTKVKTLAEVQADITDQKEAETLIDSFDVRKPLKRH